MGFFSGIGAPLRAAGLFLKHPSLIPLALIPALAALALSAAGVALAVAFSPDLFAWAWPEPPDADSLHWLWVTAAWFTRVASALLAIFITPWLIILVGLPLCEPLAAKADRLLGGQDVAGSFFGEIFKGITAGIGVVFIGLSGAIFFFFIGLIPGVGLVTTPFVLFIWTPLFLSFDLFDSSLSRRQLGFRQKLSVLMSRPLEAVGLGLIGAALTSTPLINLIGLPIAVVGGVILMRDREEAGGLPKAPTA
ncbi:EI24 domain-containing protein [Myxococcota bacterium]|nr:EI24 domain-containing protein [Myxococcota bacterium]MBU1430802.1 EI24 domain-containing protein [Myxococcota bacterium]MBU1900114.1 EI24 domain-containing protein [Myxococcota bacterium]